MKHKKKILAATFLSGMAVNEIIVGDLNWWSIEDETNNVVTGVAGRSVYLALPGSRCSGSVIARNYILSNYHCLGDGLGWFKITADYVQGKPRTQWKWYDCEKVVAANKHLDYSIAECANLDLRPISVRIDPIAQDESIFMVHQNCPWNENPFCKPYKKVSYGTIKSVNGSKLRHDADSLGGSSGAPIFDSQGSIIGLHNSGIGDNDGDGYGVENGGIVARKIIESLPENVRNQINLVGDISALQTTFQSSTPPTPSKVTWIKKKSFKCRYFGWLFKKACK